MCSCRYRHQRFIRAGDARGEATSRAPSGRFPLLDAAPLPAELVLRHGQKAGAPPTAARQGKDLSPSRSRYIPRFRAAAGRACLATERPLPCRVASGAGLRPHCARSRWRSHWLAAIYAQRPPSRSRPAGAGASTGAARRMPLAPPLCGGTFPARVQKFKNCCYTICGREGSTPRSHKQRALSGSHECGAGWHNWRRDGDEFRRPEVRLCISGDPRLMCLKR